jgi:hypothetical protein
MSVADGPLSGCEELRDRRAAVAELGAELRALADLVTRTEVPAGVLRGSARRLRELAPALRERTRDVAEVASLDDLMGRIRMFNPVTGPGNPIAPPMAIESGENGASPPPISRTSSWSRPTRGSTASVRIRSGACSAI